MCIRDRVSTQSTGDEWAAPPKDLENTADVVPEAKLENLQAEERDLAGGLATINFTFSNGHAPLQHKFVMGQTVGFVKQRLEDLSGISYSKMALSLNSKVLIDPLSLNDLPFKPNEEHDVVVTVSE
eukprot:TRINITY_DN17614_c0_g1_i1.p1 TRINITY_DN17614_c0_g1~~TRINITY_DN17614_c0_g1_i1.p1  ORF type:complete len:126 (+),score=35.23 TRINITY_DN17614_c0_g1_i1:162-539(+)